MMICSKKSSLEVGIKEALFSLEFKADLKLKWKQRLNKSLELNNQEQEIRYQVDQQNFKEIQVLLKWEKRNN